MKKVLFQLFLLLLPGVAGAQDKATTALLEKHVRHCVSSYVRFDPSAFMALYPDYGVIRRVADETGQDSAERRLFPGQDSVSMMQDFRRSWLTSFTEAYQRGAMAGINWAAVALKDLRIEVVKEPVGGMPKSVAVYRAAVLLRDQASNRQYAARIKDIVVIRGAAYGGELSGLSVAPDGLDAWTKKSDSGESDYSTGAVNDTTMVTVDSVAAYADDNMLVEPPPPPDLSVPSEDFTGKGGSATVTIRFWFGKPSLLAMIRKGKDENEYFLDLLKREGDDFGFLDHQTSTVWKLQRKGNTITGTIIHFDGKPDETVSLKKKTSRD